MSDPKNFDVLDVGFLKSAGRKVDGTDMIIDKPDKDGNGEICYKGRNRFMGYYKNEKATRETIDDAGYLHSGDIGQLDKRENLSITGRMKELIITAGGENVAPVLIENEIKTELKYLSAAMVIGD
jgi:long-chain-fatty-acid--CoA ligase ACSBG